MNSSFNLKTTYAGDVEECKEGYSDDVEPDRDPAANLKRTGYSKMSVKRLPYLVKKL